jgi:hypothetical protein
MVSEGYSLKYKNLTPTVGLSIYQKLPFNLALNLWQGAGDTIDPKDTRMWLTSKNMLEFTSGRAVVSGGMQFNYLPSEKELNPIVKVGLGFQLW